MARSQSLFAVLPGSALLMFATLLFPLSARACAPVSAENMRVQIVDESAVIVWDAAAHQEHFLRRATFNASSPDFGFLVPTPFLPTLTEVGDTPFLHLERLIRPEVIERKRTGFYFTSLLFTPLQSAAVATKGRIAEGADSVQVLTSKQVAGYDAVVLAADKADALLKWLQMHGYVARPALLAWLTPYVQAHWKITAFKIAKDNPRSVRIQSSAVKLSFTTSRPFFPYREPADQRASGQPHMARSLRVFLLSTARMEGFLGASRASASWPGKVTWANALAVDQRADLAKELALSTDQVPPGMWLTTFEDRSSPRPGTDEVYFAPARVQTPLVPPPLWSVRDARIGIPVEMLALIMALGGFSLMRWRRKREAEASLQPSLRQ